MPASTPPYPHLQAVGDSAILIEFENLISAAVNDRAIAAKMAIEAASVTAIHEVLVAYRSVLVHYNCLVSDYATLRDTLHEILSQLAATPQKTEMRQWRVPVHYGGTAGQDLEELARLHQLSSEEVIKLHLDATYRIYMLGFAPGWCYLGGLDPRLHTPRLSTPRSKVPAGCISIGGQQSMLGGQAMPSGWRLIGQTPVQSYAPNRNPAFLFRAGDRIEFYRISSQEFASLSRAAARGDLVVERCDVDVEQNQ